MEPTKDNHVYLKIAIQTVLFKHSEQIPPIAGKINDQWLESVSDEIIHKAKRFKQIAESACGNMANGRSGA